MKFVINGCYGGFGLSEKAIEMLKAKKDEEIDPDDYNDSFDYSLRKDPDLVEVVETLGANAEGEYADLEVVEVPDDITDWMITEYDGAESLYVVHDGKIKNMY